jgi:hypothetical protein
MEFGRMWLLRRFNLLKTAVRKLQILSILGCVYAVPGKGDAAEFCQLILV